MGSVMLQVDSCGLVAVEELFKHVSTIAGEDVG